MEQLGIEMLTPDRVAELWAELEPLVDASCKANDFAIDTLTPEHILLSAIAGLSVVFVGLESDKPTTVLVIQFNDQDGHKGADILAMAGKSLLKFKILYWDVILDWLRANEVEFLDTYANERLAKIYMSKYGFTKSCVCVRMPLQERYYEQIS